MTFLSLLPLLRFLRHTMCNSAQISMHADATIGTDRMKLRLLILLLLTPLAGCGYHQAGSATHIPASVRTLAVPIFPTRAQAFHTEMLFTHSTTPPLNTRTPSLHLH